MRQMKKLYLLLLILLPALHSKAQQLASVNAKELVASFAAEDTVYIVNFWATWCGPCVRELPEFNALHERFRDKPVKIVMVSLDFKESYPGKIDAFVKRKKLLPEVVWLNETNADRFIPVIEPEWQGSIPATLIIYKKNQYRKFFEGTVKADQVGLLVDKQLAY